MKTSRRSIATLIFAGSTALVASRFPTPASAESADEATVAQTVESFRKAMMSKVRADLSRLCAAQMSYGHSSGKVQTKEEFLADAVGSTSVWKELRFTDVKNSVVGENAISRFMLTGQTQADNKSTPVNIGVLMVWQKQEDGWKLLARQGFKVAEG